MKKIILLITILFLGLITIAAHKLSYNWQLTLWTLNIKYKNYYKKFFFLKDENPILVWKNKIISSYVKKCHQNEKNCLIIPHQQFYSDLIRISSIQYVGSVMASTKMPYLYGMIDNLTNLSPYWTYPYYFWELIIPISKVMYKDFPLKKKKQSWINAVKLWEKWIFFTCSQDKIKKIINLPINEFYEIVFTHTWNIRNQLKKPCIDWQIPSQGAFDRWFYLWNAEKAAKWYKIASFDPDVPKATPTLVGTVLWRTWKHEKSMIIRFNQYLTILKNLKKTKNNKTFNFYQKKAKEFLDRAIIEYQLYLLTEADKVIKNKDLTCYHNFNCLYKKGIIQKIISEEIKKCKNFKNINIENIKTNPKNIENLVSDQIKCILLSYALQNHLINPNGDINTILIHPSDKSLKFIYDYDLWDWWLWVK